jgi:predicted alpha/beta-fold hydrolase
VPTLIVHSLDDPFIRMLPETREALLGNPKVTFVETQHGGHCAFLAAAATDDGRWAERMLLGFILRGGAECAHGG